MKLQTGRWVATAAMAATLVACGGGGGSSSPTGPSNGSAARTWVTGAIDGFGSVIVNGVHYETGSSSVTIEGRSGTEGELEVGDVVRIEAERDSSGRMQARSIDQDRLVQGTVQSVDVAAGTLVAILMHRGIHHRYRCELGETPWSGLPVRRNLRRHQVRVGLRPTRCRAS